MTDRDLAEILAHAGGAQRPSDVAGDGRHQGLLDHLAAARAAVERVEQAVRRAPNRSGRP